MKSFLAIAGVVAVACLFIGAIAAYDVWFGQNCLRSHQRAYTYYSYHCLAYSRKGICTSSVMYPQIGYETVCDEWKR